MSLFTFFITLTIVALFIFLIGLCVGSFLNVVVSRAFSNESIVLPRSKCPKCQTQLKWYHNIPVLSYLFLRGKCAFCQEKISIQYPILELVTGVLFVATAFKFWGLNLLFIWIFVSLFVVIAATDIKEKVIFDFHTYIMIAMGLIYNLFNIGHIYSGGYPFHIGPLNFVINNSLIASLLGILVGVVFMELFARFGYLVAGVRAFGEGDTYIAAGLGAIFGIWSLLSVLLYAFVLQIAFTLPVFVKKLYDRKDYKTLISFFVFFGLIVLMKTLDNLAISNSLILFGAFALLLCVVGVYICKRILCGLKDSENMTYLPFGPALVLGGLIAFFTVTFH